ncbi:multidrug effflux MFS transporter [Marinomonas spartinae]|uniref:multidrug effflux MFS transporter n=1 Tax=Marinomonas spartinae TaxID=1792290 RepID=UPI0018F1325D|nr:multidrug effflux MFS transporter [Marinomonas spartinae]MBJ7553497.1 multidrug effflux MFS transporter [Marinomonas spartinae]
MNSLKSRLLIPLLGCLVAFGPLSIDMYLPSLPTIAYDLGTSNQIIQTTITVFLLGMALGMLLFGPLSDLLGRKSLLIVGIICYLLSSFGCSIAASGESLIAYRFLQSLGGAAASILGRALVRDLFELKRAASILSYMHVISMMVMLVSPILGAAIVDHFDWRWIFYVLALFSLITLLSSIWILPSEQSKKKQSFHITHYVENYLICLRAPLVVQYALTNAFSFAGMFAFIATSSFIYIEHYHISKQHYAMLFSANIFAIILITLLNSYLSKRFTVKAALYCMIFVSFSATLMIWYAYFFTQVPMTLFIAATMIYISVTGAIGANSLAILFSQLPDKAGTTSGLLVAVQFAMGSLISYIASLLFDGSPQILLIMMGSCGILCSSCFISTLITRAKQV